MYPYFKDIDSIIITNFWEKLPEIEKEILKRYMVISTNNRIVISTRSSFSIGGDGEFYHNDVKYQLKKEHILPLPEQHQILVVFIDNVVEGVDMIRTDNYIFKFDDNSVWVCDVLKK
ncbi:hypothetical protein [Carboxylicivirga sp. RSCT41]|uniref:hypothetical protein n=1 Tax=Carboxylicivirga agarovorans TaxID=3417570 RepID=UPI003D32CB2A